MEEKKQLSRRGFLKTATLIGASLAAQPILSKAVKTQNILSDKSTTSAGTNVNTAQRTLGVGKAPLTVSDTGKRPRGGRG